MIPKIVDEFENLEAQSQELTNKELVLKNV